MLPYPVCFIDSCGRHYLLLSPFESDYSHTVHSALCLNNIRLMFHAPDSQSLVRSALCRSNIRFMFHTPDCPIFMHFTLRRLVWSFMHDRGRAPLKYPYESDSRHLAHSAMDLKQHFRSISACCFKNLFLSIKVRCLASLLAQATIISYQAFSLCIYPAHSFSFFQR